MSDAELLKFAIENGMIDPALVQEKIEMQKRKELLEKHPFKIWKGQNGSWYTYLPDDKGGRVLKKRKDQQSIEDLVVKYYMDVIPTVYSTFYQWISQKVEYNEISQGTYRRYETDFNAYIKPSELCDMPINQITTDILEDYVRITIARHGLSTKAYSNLRTILNGIFKYAKKKKYVDFSITQFFADLELSRKVFHNKIKADETQVFSEEEVTQIIKYLSSHLDTLENLGILFLFQTGLRVGEIASLKPKDRVNEKVFHVCRTEISYKDIETGKIINTIKDSPKTPTGDRYVIMTDGAADTWNRVLELSSKEEYLFESNGRRLRCRVFYDRINKICDILGMKRRSTHKIRKTYGTELLNSGVDEKLITRQMGHVSIATTKGHYFYDNKTIDRKVEILNNAMTY